MYDCVSVCIGMRLLSHRLYDALSLSIHVAKFEEADEGLPTIQVMIEVAELSPGTPDYYTKEEFQKMELYLLRFFNWSVSFPSSAHFADYYLQYGSLLDDKDDLTNTTQLKDGMETYTTDFLEAALRGEHLGIDTIISMTWVTLQM